MNEQLRDQMMAFAAHFDVLGMAAGRAGDAIAAFWREVRQAIGAWREGAPARA